MHASIDSKSLQLIENSNRIGVDFLRADLDTGLTFLKIACTTTYPDGRARNFAKALLAYRTVLRFLPRVTPSPDEQLEIRAKLEELRLRLEGAGYSCEI